jgi:PST family polysaccharide transporter
MVLVTGTTLLLGAGTYGRLIVTRRLSPADIRRATVSNLAVGTAVATVVAVLATPIIDAFATGGDPGVLRALAATIAIFSASVVPTTCLQRRMHFRRYALLKMLAAATASGAAVGSAALGAGVWALVVRQVVYQVVIAVSAWWLARDIVRGIEPPTDPPGEAAEPRGYWFQVLAGADFVTFSSDFLVMGALTDAGRLGLYSFAFALAFAPLAQFAWQIGGVLFAVSASTDDAEAVKEKLLRALRMTALLLVPMIPPAVVLAPAVFPRFLGPEWSPVVVPFQVLLVVGIGHAVLNVMGEFLNGTGNVRFRAVTSLVSAVAMPVALVVLVARYGLAGAVAAHAVLFLAVATAYTTTGARRIGLAKGQLLGAVAPVGLRVVAQAVVTVITGAALREIGVDDLVAALVGSCAGVVVLVLMLYARSPEVVRQATDLVAGARRRGP